MLSTGLIFQAAGFALGEAEQWCWLCGGPAFSAVPVAKFVKPTFTDHDKAVCPFSEVVCGACVFCCNERSELLAERVGKDKPQRMRNYSHFVVNGKWIPLGKGDKSKMAELLLDGPQLAVVAISGQKHLIFRAQPGWWQVEEQSSPPFPDELRHLLGLVEDLYAGFSKAEIESGQYAGHRVNRFGLEEWWALESQIREKRGSLPFTLALFLAQKEAK